MSKGSSYRQIIRSSSIIGGASVVSILVGLVRMKAVALLLGPSGVGLIGLLTQLVATASGVAGLGIGNVGTRQIAEAVASDEPAQIANARTALFWGTLFLAGVGTLAFWLLRDQFAVVVLGDPERARDVGWVSIAVGLTVAGSSQFAVLNGLRRVQDIAKLQVWSAVLSTGLGLLALALLGRSAIVVFVISVPLAGFLLGHWFVATAPKQVTSSTSLREMSVQWKALVRLGSAFMFAGLAGPAALLTVSTMVQRELGADALGQFQTAWAISMTYIGFILSAMGTDYYPRLTGAIRDDVVANRLVNEQVEVALLLASPALMTMQALSPWIVQLLYTAEFAEAALILRWQVVGDFLKVASWPLGFILLAAGAGRAFVFTQWIGVGGFVLISWLGIPFVSTTATGLAFIGLYAVYLPLVYWIANKRSGFRFSSSVGRLLALGLSASISVLMLSWSSDRAAAVVGLGFAVGFAGHGLPRLAGMLDVGEERSGAVGRILRTLARRKTRPATVDQDPDR